MNRHTSCTKLGPNEPYAVYIFKRHRSPVLIVLRPLGAFFRLKLELLLGDAEVTMTMMKKMATERMTMMMMKMKKMKRKKKLKLKMMMLTMTTTTIPLEQD